MNSMKRLQMISQLQLNDTASFNKEQQSSDVPAFTTTSAEISEQTPTTVLDNSLSSVALIQEQPSNEASTENNSCSISLTSICFLRNEVLETLSFVLSEKASIPTKDHWIYMSLLIDYAADNKPDQSFTCGDIIEYKTEPGFSDGKSLFLCISQYSYMYSTPPFDNAERKGFFVSDNLTLFKNLIIYFAFFIFPCHKILKYI